MLQIGKTTTQYVPESFDLHIAVIQRSLHTLARCPIDTTDSDTYNFIQRPGYASAAVAVAKQMTPSLDKFASWKNVGSFRDVLEELLQTTLHAIAISPSAVTVTPNKSIVKKRARRLQWRSRPGGCELSMHAECVRNGNLFSLPRVTPVHYAHSLTFLNNAVASLPPDDEWRLLLLDCEDALRTMVSGPAAGSKSSGSGGSGA